MNCFRKSLVVLVAVAPLVLMHVSRVAAVGPKISEYRIAPNYNKHNLSAKSWNSGSLIANPNPYRAREVADGGNPGGQQICIFCHTPHNAKVENQAPLWNRKFSSETFSRYSSATLQIRHNSAARTASGYLGGTPGAQPDGASKLCLSCHDGSSEAGRGLGDVLRGGPITMVLGKEYIDPASLASFNPTSNPNKMKTGHHPVSFVYNGTVQQAISSARLTDGFKLPTAVPQVKLDKNKKMQCTTCHDPHQNQSDDAACYDGGVPATCGTPVTATRKVVPFWVYGVSGNASTDHDAVCTSCHNMSPKPSWP